MAGTVDGEAPQLCRCQRVTGGRTVHPRQPHYWRDRQTTQTLSCNPWTPAPAPAAAAQVLVALTGGRPLSMAQRAGVYAQIDAAKAKCTFKADRNVIYQSIDAHTRCGWSVDWLLCRSGS